MMTCRSSGGDGLSFDASASAGRTSAFEAVPSRDSTSRRACRVPRLARVISRSTNGRTSLAFATVVTMRSWRNSANARLRNSALRWAALRPRRRPAFRCLMSLRSWLPAYVACLSPRRAEPHAQRQAALGQLLLHFLQRRLAEVPHLQQLAVVADDEVAHRRDPFRLQ